MLVLDKARDNIHIRLSHIGKLRDEISYLNRGQDYLLDERQFDLPKGIYS